MYIWIIKIAIDVAKTSHLTSYKFNDLSTHFIQNLSIIGDYLLRNDVYAEMYMPRNHDKRRDPMQ